MSSITIDSFVRPSCSVELEKSSIIFKYGKFHVPSFEKFAKLVKNEKAIRVFVGEWSQSLSERLAQLFKDEAFAGVKAVHCILGYKLVFLTKESSTWLVDQVFECLNLLPLLETLFLKLQKDLESLVMRLVTPRLVSTVVDLEKVPAKVKHLSTQWVIEEALFRTLAKRLETLNSGIYLDGATELEFDLDGLKNLGFCVVDNGTTNSDSPITIKIKGASLFNVCISDLTERINFVFDINHELNELWFQTKSQTEVLPATKILGGCKINWTDLDKILSKCTNIQFIENLVVKNDSDYKDERLHEMLEAKYAHVPNTRLGVAGQGYKVKGDYKY